MSLIVKIMHHDVETLSRDAGDADGPHSIYGDVTSIHFPERGAAQMARLYVREPIKTALVPGFCENEKFVDLTGPAYVMNEAGRTISSYRPIRPGGDIGPREPVFKRYDGYEKLSVTDA